MSSYLDDATFQFGRLNYRSFSDYLNSFPELKQFIQQIAINDEWSGEQFATLKRLTISDESLHCGINDKDLRDITSSNTSYVLMYVTGCKEEKIFYTAAVSYPASAIVIRLSGLVTLAINMTYESTGYKFSYRILQFTEDIKNTTSQGYMNFHTYSLAVRFNSSRRHADIYTNITTWLHFK